MISKIENSIVIISLIVGVFLLMIIFYLIYKLRQSQRKRKESENKFHQLEGKINKLELQSLESKLNPHLFKNILNSIQSHAYQTYFALDKLANVLDYILYESRKKFVTPKEEVEFAQNLIEINKIKISPLFNLKVKTKINPNEPLFEQRLMAPLISIDLLENAFKHADLQSSDSFISVIFEFIDSQFSLTVSNKISRTPPLKKEKSGLGIETLEHRLSIIYGKNFKLQRFSEGDIYFAQLKINLIGHKAEMLASR
ncbi:sensor histidine kinase [Arthrospiribacter ruber]|uniref:Histidine kinase n=1 Tax=Arthrospiribacter ruber TaxID=2487934 RepID=A0A951IZF2_9BACT|nr:histidine kinase [Arthrospiribacter ruber]MBW3470000.1 histidine kinase [Arthrospiribacter ruber]